MEVTGIGNVIGVTDIYIFTRGKGKMSRLKINKARVMIIYNTCVDNEKFYTRMCDELRNKFEEFKETVERNYHYITDDDVNKAFNRSRKEGLSLSIEQTINNKEFFRQSAYQTGLFMAVKYASDKENEAYRIRLQTENAIRRLERK